MIWVVTVHSVSAVPSPNTHTHTVHPSTLYPSTLSTHPFYPTQSLHIQAQMQQQQMAASRMAAQPQVVYQQQPQVCTAATLVVNIQCTRYSQVVAKFEPY